MKKILFILILFPFLVFSQLEQPKSDSIIQYKFFSIEYSETYKVAKWSAYKFYKDMTIKNFKRYSRFHTDLQVRNKVTNIDYKKSGFDRGHLSPIANFRFDYDAMIETNYYTNICPQTPSFNRGIWKKLENQVRRWVLEYDTLYIVSGPILSGNNKTIGNKITISSMFYKVILAWDGTKYKSIAFLIPNKKSNKSIFEYQVTIDFLEVLTNIDFFYRLNDNNENELELLNTLK